MKFRCIIVFILFISMDLLGQIPQNERMVNKSPVYPGCGIFSEEYKRVCFEEKLNKHIFKHFRYPKSAIDSGYQGKVSIEFRLNEKGMVENILADGSYSILEKEAIRIISKLPRMKPARDKKGRPIAVPFRTSITFRLE